MVDKVARKCLSEKLALEKKVKEVRSDSGGNLGEEHFERKQQRKTLDMGVFLVCSRNSK